ncbi:hypothetical protein AMTRI_Chr10g6260 [Amborella trichopoda]
MLSSTAGCWISYFLLNAACSFAKPVYDDHFLLVMLLLKRLIGELTTASWVLLLSSPSGLMRFSLPASPNVMASMLYCLVVYIVDAFHPATKPKMVFSLIFCNKPQIGCLLQQTLNWCLLQQTPELQCLIIYTGKSQPCATKPQDWCFVFLLQLTLNGWTSSTYPNGWCGISKLLCCVNHIDNCACFYKKP